MFSGVRLQILVALRLYISDVLHEFFLVALLVHAEVEAGLLLVVRVDRYPVRTVESLPGDAFMLE